MQLASENTGRSRGRVELSTRESSMATALGLDFVAAAESHVLLFSNLRLYLQGEAGNTDGDFVEHRQKCDLGKWLQGMGLARFGHLSAFRRLRDVHEQFHLDADIVLKRLHEGSWISAEQVCKRDLSHSLRRLLMTLTELNEVIRTQIAEELS